MSEKNEPVFENEEFLMLLQKYETMRKSKSAAFFDVEEFEQIIDYYLDEFQYEHAAEAAELGTEQHPASVEIRYKVVHIYLEQGMGRQALEVLGNIPAYEHGNAEFYYLRGTALCVSGRIQEAEKDFDKGLSITTEDPFEALLNIAIAFENARQYRHAIKYLEQAHRISPEYLSVIYDLGYFHERIDQYGKSVEYYQLYLDHDPFSENVWYNLGVAYFKLEQPLKAVEAYDYSLALNPDYASAHFNKASAYNSMGEYKKAIETINEFLLKEPDNTQALVFLGDAYEQLGDLQKALETYKKIIELDNTDSEGWFGAGMVQYQLNKFDEATIYLLKALEFDNQNTDYWINLGYVYQESGKSDEALKCFARTVKIDKTDREAWNELAGLLITVDRYSEALDVLRGALAVFPGDEGFLVRQAECYYRLGDKAGGVAALEKALEKNPKAVVEFMMNMEDMVLDAATRRMIQRYTH